MRSARPSFDPWNKSEGMQAQDEGDECGQRPLAN